MDKRLNGAAAGSVGAVTDAPEVARRLGEVFDELAARGRARVAELAPGELRRLEAFGLEVANGWAQVDGAVDLLRHEAVRAALTPPASSWLARLDLRAHLPSTNTALLERARRESVNGHVLAAEVQTAGRGRRGRAWHSPFGRNLALSFGLALPRPVAQMGAFSLVVGLAVRAALGDIGVRDAALKWPNDVLLEGRKLAGILIEIGGPPARDAVVGIGVNVDGARKVARRVRQPVADVTERVRAPSRNVLLAALINQLVEATGCFAKAGFAPFVAEWERVHHHQNTTVTLALPGGADAVTGTALGVDCNGALRLATAQGVRVFVSGEVSLRAGAPADQAGARSA